ncbi:protein kinase domain-containing protein [Actinomadura fibrosa]|uniref:Peptidylprolyl isomerase n=1 Tax=Actinomadura fibrosa TaxID=111802 RepID=A0ABW2XC84_9ACTN|nr:peptidylprolyl isomerase [Actinomadura fibrosa]
MPEPRPLRPNDPREIGGFRLTARLGEGSQGVVYLGTSGTGERVAVKVLHAEIDGDERARTLFERELATAGQVAPFCTARIITAKADGDSPYIVSEYIDGPSLRQSVAECGPFPAAELTRLAIGTATALAAIHEAGVVHRDLKPANVLLGPDGPKVIDFGIARSLEATSASLTGAVGTPAYMAPEQIAGTTGGPPLDLFAWACTMAYAANGTPPFGQDSIPAIMHRILHAPPELGRLDGPLRDLVASCLAKDPARRPTALDVLKRLLGTDRRENLLAEGTSAAATLTGRGGAFPPPVPAGFAPPPFARPGPPYPYATFPPAPGTTVPGPGAPKKNSRLLVIGAVAAVALLAVAGTTAAVLLNGDDDKGGRPQSSTTTSASQAASRCTYLPATADKAVVKDVGTPSPNPQARGLVTATVQTNLGRMVLELDASKAPCTVNSMVYLANRKYYDGTSCHRLTTTTELKVLQCGDPSGTGTGGPSYRFGSENLGPRYARGVVAMANAGTADSNGSQFFILYDDAPTLSPSYTVFGRVTGGMDIVDQVARAGVDGQDDGKPKRKITISTLRTRSA